MEIEELDSNFWSICMQMNIYYVFKATKQKRKLSGDGEYCSAVVIEDLIEGRRVLSWSWDEKFWEIEKAF